MLGAKKKSNFISMKLKECDLTMSTFHGGCVPADALPQRHIQEGCKLAVTLQMVVQSYYWVEVC